MLSVGIVGLPNAGKSTLFNALVQRYQAKVAPYAFTTIDPNVGVVEVPDERLEWIARAIKLPKKIPATIELVDIAGLVKWAHSGAGLGNQFLSHIRGVDAILHVVRGYPDPVSHQPANPATDYQIIREELLAADQEKNIPPDQKLATKPELVVLNMKESETAEASLPDGFPKNTLIVSAKLEADLVELPEAERPQYLTALGLSESLLPRVIRAAYELLGLITFYTLLPDQVRAWLIPRGTKAPQAAGKIHTDFERHFIAAEAIGADELASFGSWHEARQHGKIRTEGKEYVIQDGDVVHFNTAA